MSGSENQGAPSPAPPREGSHGSQHSSQSPDQDAQLNATTGHGHAHGGQPHAGHGHAHGTSAPPRSDHGHAHSNAAGHGHAHGLPLGASASVRRALGGSLVLNALFLVVELSIGFWTGSLALLSDAAHMVSDVLALSLALGASAVAARLTDSERTFGLLRAEALGAFVNALALVVTCGFIFKEAFSRLLGAPPPIAGWPVLVAGVLGLLINLGSAWMLARADRGNLNVRGALLHMLSDALGSAGAILAAVLILTGIPAADAAMSLLIGALVLLGTWTLLRDSTAVLLEFSPRGLSVRAVQRELSGLPHVASVHDLHIWSLDGKTPILSAHLIVDSEPAATDLLREAETLLARRFGVTHSTLQLEAPGGDPCRASECCNLLPQSAAASEHLPAATG